MDWTNVRVERQPIWGDRYYCMQCGLEWKSKMSAQLCKHEGLIMDDLGTCEVGEAWPEGTCGKPAIEVMTTACMHGHTETFRVCADDRQDAWQGLLGCTPCHIEHGAATRTFPQIQAHIITEKETPDEPRM